MRCYFLYSHEKLLVATSNVGKFQEIKRILNDIPYKLVGLDSIEGGISDINESGSTYVENAVQKATHYAEKTSLFTLAEDSGLEVKALNNEPGLYSRRYFDGKDSLKYKKLLQKLTHVKRKDRTATFYSAVALYDPKTNILRTVQAFCSGVISSKPSGYGGFGYDPVFFLPDRGKTMAELTLEEKNVISHRGKALREIKILLSDFL